MVDFLALFGTLLGSIFTMGFCAIGICICAANCAELISQQVAAYKIRRYVSAYQRDLNRSLR